MELCVWCLQVRIWSSRPRLRNSWARSKAFPLYCISSLLLGIMLPKLSGLKQQPLSFFVICRWPCDPFLWADSPGIHGLGWPCPHVWVIGRTVVWREPRPWLHVVSPSPAVSQASSHAGLSVSKAAKEDKPQCRGNFKPLPKTRSL